MSVLAWFVGSAMLGADPRVQVEQITFGPKHHFFGYIGQCGTTPWNGSGRYIAVLRIDFHHRMPQPGKRAEIVLLDVQRRFTAEVVEHTGAWNFQQGTMLYWNPESPDTQLFFNDRDAATDRVFTVLFNVEKRERVREYRFDDVSIANGGIAQGGGWFAAINYGRLARLRPVTGYPGAFDWTTAQAAPVDDGVFKVDVSTGEKELLVSFRTLAEELRPTRPDVDQVPLFINHTLCNRTNEYIYFFVRGRFGERAERIDVPFTVRSDGTGLTQHEHIGGHPEWGEGTSIIGRRADRQVLYDVENKVFTSQIGDPTILPNPEGDIALSPDARWLANGYSTSGSNRYVIYRLSDGAYTRSAAFSRGDYTHGDLRIDPAPCWNRTNDALLVSAITHDGTRQLFILRVDP